MQTLFDITHDDDPIKPSQEEALGRAMSKQWQEDLEIIRERGVIPDFLGEPSPLSKDKARLLELLYECGSIEWHSVTDKNNREVTKAMGLSNTGNAKAVIAQCCAEGLVSSRVYRGAQIFELTMIGEFALDEHQENVRLGWV